jgi:hypothetical protein
MQATIGYVAAGVGVAVGAAAVVTGAGSMHLTDQVTKDIELHKQTYGESCDKNPANARLCAFDRDVINYDSDRANTLANVSLGTAIAGGLLLAGGVTLILFAPDGPLGPKAAPAPQDASARPARPKPTTSVSAACGPLLTGGVSCAGTF